MGCAEVNENLSGYSPNKKNSTDKTLYTQHIITHTHQYALDRYRDR